MLNVKNTIRSHTIPLREGKFEGGGLIDKPGAQTVEASVQKVQQSRFGACQAVLFS